MTAEVVVVVVVGVEMMYRDENRRCTCSFEIEPIDLG